MASAVPPRAHRALRIQRRELFRWSNCGASFRQRGDRKRSDS
jgi:hypothetical protein